MSRVSPAAQPRVENRVLPTPNLAPLVTARRLFGPGVRQSSSTAEAYRLQSCRLIANLDGWRR